jgi:5'-phosphate synthase pdxT subunit
VGVLALQGAFARHQRMLESLGARTVAVRRAVDLDAVEKLVLPGGESSTISMLLQRSGLHEPLAARLAGGLACFGTCAGTILLAAEVLDGRDDQRSFGVLDAVVRRNAYGRQVDSFEASLDVEALGPPPLRGVFIRAPVIESVGPDVEVLATWEDRPVICRTRTILTCTFHPELTDDDRLHRLFLEM